MDNKEILQMADEIIEKFENESIDFRVVLKKVLISHLDAIDKNKAFNPATMISLIQQWLFDEVIERVHGGKQSFLKE